MELSSAFCNNLYGKRTPKTRVMLFVYVIVESDGCPLTRGTKLEIKEKWKKEKESHSVPSDPLTWVAIPSLEPEQAWVPLLECMGVETAGQGALMEPPLKPVLLGLLGWERVSSAPKVSCPNSLTTLSGGYCRYKFLTADFQEANCNW